MLLPRARAFQEGTIAHAVPTVGRRVFQETAASGSAGTTREKAASNVQKRPQIHRPRDERAFMQASEPLLGQTRKAGTIGEITDTFDDIKSLGF